MSLRATAAPHINNISVHNTNLYYYWWMTDDGWLYNANDNDDDNDSDDVFLIPLQSSSYSVQSYNPSLKY